jgi:ribosomal protein S27E
MWNWVKDIIYNHGFGTCGKCNNSQWQFDHAEEVGFSITHHYRCRICGSWAIKSGGVSKRRLTKEDFGGKNEEVVSL